MRNTVLRLIALLTIVTVFAFPGMVGAANSPKSVAAKVTKSDDSFPTLQEIRIEVTDGNGEVAVYDGGPDARNIITDYVPETGLIIIQMGNFNTQWDEGDTISISVTAGSEEGSTSTTLDADSPQTYVNDSNLLFQTQAPSDSTGPATSNVVVTPNSVFQGQSAVTLTASITDAVNHVVSFEYAQSSNAPTGSGTSVNVPAQDQATSVNVSTSVSVGSLAPDTYKYWVRGKDAAGNLGDWAATTTDLTVSSNPGPSVSSLTTEPASPVLQGTSVTLRTTLSNTGAGQSGQNIDRLEYGDTTANSPPASGTQVAVASPAPTLTNYGVSIGAPAAGTHYYWIRGRDLLGKWGPWSSSAMMVVNANNGPTTSSVRVDNLTSFTMVEGGKSTVTLTALVSDPDLHAISTSRPGEWYWSHTGDPGEGNANAMTISSGSGSSVTVRDTGVSVGSLTAQNSPYTLNVRGQDTHGRWGAVQQFTVTVITCDVTPTFTITPISGGSVEVGQSITFTNTSTGTGASGATYDWNFGDGTTLSNVGKTPNRTHTFTSLTQSGSPLQVILTGEGSDGCSQTETQEVNVICDVQAAFSASQTQVVKGATVTFTNASSGSGRSGATYTWNYGDGTVENNVSFGDKSHTYSTPGTYTVSLTASGYNGCTSSAQQRTITVLQCDVSAAFTPDDLIIRTGESILFTNGSTGSFAANAKYDWDFGDGRTLSNMSKTNQSNTYEDPGEYTVTLIAKGSTGCTSEVSRNVYVGGECTVDAGYGVSQTQVEIDESISFTDQSTGTPNVWAWDFGDGAFAAVQNPVHAFETVGEYPVILAAGKEGGCFAYAADRTITVVCNVDAAFDLGSEENEVGDSVQFVNMSTGGAADANQVTWAWDFDGDGSTDSTAESPSFAYTTAGTYTVQLTATSRSTSGAARCSDTASKVVVINPPDSIKPEAAFDVAPANGTAPLTVTVTDQSLCSGCTIGSWKFTFGDGSAQQEFTAAPAAFTHTYSQPGSYTILLEVTATNGAGDTMEKTVTADQQGPTDPTAPIARFLASTDGSDPFTIHFTDQSTPQDRISTRTWNFGDNSAVSAEQNPTHTYGQAGTYTVQLAVTDLDGESSTVSNTVSVCLDPDVTPAFNAGPTNGTGTLTVQFTDQSTSTCGPVSAWQWDFGDGGTSTSQNPTHTYTTAGTYTVKLTVTGPGEKQESVTQTDLITVQSGGSVSPVTAPELISPANGQTEVALRPELKARHTDEAMAHQKTHWRILTETGEGVWEAANAVTVGDGSLPELMIQVPDLFLEANTRYQWSARVESTDGQVSDWAAAGFFTTVAIDPEDPDGTGVPTAQRPAEDAITETFPELTPGDLTKFVNAADGGGMIGLEALPPVIAVASLKAVPASAAPALANTTFPWGFISFKLQVNPGDTVQVKLHFSTPLPAGITWYKFRNDGSDTDALTIFNQVIISADRRTATLTLVDGGEGDLDNLVNGWIIDPIGFGITSQTPPSEGDGDGDGDTCFIGTADAPGRSLVLTGLGILLGMLWINRGCRSLKR